MHKLCMRPVVCRHQRRPMEANPEAVLAKSDMECSTAAAFLHENMVEFLDGEAIEDAANACQYLSQSGLSLLCCGIITTLRCFCHRHSSIPYKV